MVDGAWLDGESDVETLIAVENLPAQSTHLGMVDHKVQVMILACQHNKACSGFSSCNLPKHVFGKLA